MSTTPGPDDEQQPDKPEQGQNPFAGTPFEALGQFGLGPGMDPSAGGDPAQMLAQLQQQMQSILSGWDDGPINWKLAEDMARLTIRQAGDASLTAAERATINDAVQLAEHWLDGATELPASTAGAAAWNRADWLDNTLPTWKKLVDPLAGHIVKAMGSALPQEAEQLAGPFGQMMEKAGGLMFGVQVGQGLGRLATEVCGASDVGFPLGRAGQPALVPANVAAFGEGLDVPLDDVRLYLALRECAYQRLVHHAPWLSSHLVSAVEEYARGMHVDLGKFEELSSGGFDPSNPEALQEALGSGLLEPEETPRQKAALARLETMLALVEGWVDEVVTQAAKPRMPSAGQLQEAIRRRRAEGGPAEQTFSTLVGLELRPRRLRDAAALWGAMRELRSPAERDALWAHPDLLPSSDDLDDPLGFVESNRTADSFDIGDLSELTGEGPSEPGGTDASGGSGGSGPDETEGGSDDADGKG